MSDRPTMFAILIGPAEPMPGDLVKIEVPHNCAVYETNVVTAREKAFSWFCAGSAAEVGDKNQAESYAVRAAFEHVWNLRGMS